MVLLAAQCGKGGKAQAKFRDVRGQATRGREWEAGGPDSTPQPAGSLRSFLSQRLARSDLCFRKMTLAAREEAAVRSLKTEL